MGKPHLILSLDGGGIRGVFTAALLTHLERERPFLAEVDLFAGTSTGGILCLGLASGLSPLELQLLYANQGKEIFASRGPLDELSGADELIRADFDNRQGLAKVLTRTFGDKTLGDLDGRVLITTFDLFNTDPQWRQWKPKFMHNYDTEGNDKHVRVADAALRTSAAPTYFPSWGQYVDGGVAANNPSMCAVAKVRRDGTDFDAIRVLSLGAVVSRRGVPGRDLDWGKLRWAFPIVPLLMDGMVGIAHYQCKHLLGDQYRRLNETVDDIIDLADVSQIDRLVALADQLARSAEFEGVVTWLDDVLSAP